MSFTGLLAEHSLALSQKTCCERDNDDKTGQEVRIKLLIDIWNSRKVIVFISFVQLVEFYARSGKNEINSVNEKLIHSV